MKLVFLDIETTGLDPLYHKIIEIGCAKVENGLIIDTFSRLIDPKESLSNEIKKITGLSDYDFFEKAVDLNVALKEFEDFIEDYPVIGHNAISFDIPFIERYLGKELKNRVSDTLLISKFLAPNLKSHSLRNALSHFGIESYEKHRSLEDVFLTIKLWEILKERGRTIEKSFIKSYAEKMFSKDIKTLNAFYIFIEDL
jgi:DNA polymerase-3 subunit alpha (Gram-positive type)